MPEHLSFLDWLIWQGPAILAVIGMVICIVMPILIHLNRKGY